VHKKILIETKPEKYWLSVVMMSGILFFVYLADAILSDWVPAFLDERMGGPMMMGVIMSFSSVAGLLADLVLPQILKAASAWRLMLMAIVSSIVFAILLIWGAFQPVVWVAITAVIVWGIYYEFLAFGRQQMVADLVPKDGRSSAWGILEISISLAYFLGPIIGGILLYKMSFDHIPAVSLFISLLSVVLLMLWKKKIQNKRVLVDEPVHRLDIVEELEHWWVLSRYVWPVLVISLMMGVIDATYWTVGVILSDNLSQSAWWGQLFLPMYMLPAVLVGVILQRVKIKSGKKRVAIFSTMLSGISLALMGSTQTVEVLLLLSFGTGVALAVSWPMINAVYSDILSRMGREKKHMMGLSSSMTSMAYIVGPLLAGFLASIYGYKHVFVIMGVSTLVVMSVILMLMPKKIRMPQKQIERWT
jgi:MFS family permease